MFNEIKRVTTEDECGQIITRLCSLNDYWFVEQLDTLWKRVEKDIAFTLEEAEAMFTGWTR